MSCDVRYLDGRNHALDLVSKFVKKKSKKHSKKKIIKLLKDRWGLEAALDDFDHGYFTDYKE